MTIPGYDAWKLASPDDGEDIGTEEGDTCNRIEEPDEDAPRGEPKGGGARAGGRDDMDDEIPW